MIAYYCRSQISMFLHGIGISLSNFCLEYFAELNSIKSKQVKMMARSHPHMECIVYVFVPTDLLIKGYDYTSLTNILERLYQ